MKKVWILEKWIDKEAEKEILNFHIELKSSMTEEQLAQNGCESLIDSRIKLCEDRINDPSYTGRWDGWEGKCNYKSFCERAVDSIYFDKKNSKSAGKPCSKFRVVSAYVDDSDDSWIHYFNPTVNDGVLKYLYVKVKNYYG